MILFVQLAVFHKNFGIGKGKRQERRDRIIEMPNFFDKNGENLKRYFCFRNIVTDWLHMGKKFEKCWEEERLARGKMGK